jgi:hypothetical protein
VLRRGGPIGHMQDRTSHRSCLARLPSHGTDAPLPR